jgi:4-hydroxy-tetrahydrodipicolinate synthase
VQVQRRTARQARGADRRVHAAPAAGHLDQVLGQPNGVRLCTGQGIGLFDQGLWGLFLEQIERLHPQPIGRLGPPIEPPGPFDLEPFGRSPAVPARLYSSNPASLTSTERKEDVTEALRGTWFVLPTPFTEEGAVDLPSQTRLVEAVIGWGVDGLTAMGVTSEATALTSTERSACLDAIFEAAAGRVPVVVGCSAGSAPPVGELIEEAKGLGAAAAMVSAPPLFRDVDLLPDFYRRVASGGLALVIQDEPAATGVVIPVRVLLECVEASGARVIKLEDPPTPHKIARLLAADPRLQVFGGLGGVSALSELRRGACGTMTGFAFPEILAAVRRRVESGDAHGAAVTFDRFLPLIQFEAQPQVGLAIRKELLRRRGVINAGRTRGGIRTIDLRTARELDELLERLAIEPTTERLEVT